MLELKNVKKSYDGTPGAHRHQPEYRGWRDRFYIRAVRMRQDDASEPDPRDRGFGRRTDHLQRRGHHGCSYGEERIQYRISGLRTVPEPECLPEHYIRAEEQSGDLFQRRSGRPDPTCSALRSI